MSSLSVDMLWLTENDADQSSDGDAEPKLRRRLTTSTNNNVESTSTDEQLEYANKSLWRRTLIRPCVLMLHFLKIERVLLKSPSQLEFHNDQRWNCMTSISLSFLRIIHR